VIDVVKKPFDVRVHDPAETLPSQLVDAMDGVLDRAPLPESVAAVLEFGFEDLAGEPVDGGLHHPVADRGHGEAPELGAALRNLELEQRERVIAAPDQTVLEMVDLDLQEFMGLLDRDAVHAAAAALLADVIEGRIEGFP
jgi:hypothetical protein